ncbi:hypothetical protein [Plantibacter sp. LMC-P-059a]|uniref:hypothetical protein n=1 Tax=Plantibacter sp. LMC-P-059a TaxID=3040297 RepID=UPI00254CEEEC|nr:hypothetical protein [Plantibacter sp. LMC-P-059a]
MNLTRDEVVDADRAGLADFLERHTAVASEPVDDASHAIAPHRFSFDGSSSDLYLDPLDQEGPVTGGIWHATLSAQECDFIFELCVAGNLVIVNPQGAPNLLVPGPGRDAAALPTFDGPTAIVSVESGADLRRWLTGGFEGFARYRDVVTGRVDAPPDEQRFASRQRLAAAATPEPDMQQTRGMTNTPNAFPPLIVGTDAPAIRRVFRNTIVLTSVLAVLSAVGAVALGMTQTSLGSALFASGLVLLTTGYLVFGTVYLIRTARKRASLGSVLTLDAAGMEWTMLQGSIFLPWHLISSVTSRKRLRHRVLTYRMVDGVTGTTEGVRSTLKPKHHRTISNLGLQVGSAGIDVPIDTIAAATVAFTNGRLDPR